MPEQDAKPVRLQRKRTKGYRLTSPNGLPIVCVTRPGKWGNHFVVCRGLHGVKSSDGKFVYVNNKARAVDAYRDWAIRSPAVLAEIKRELRGKNLACYCKILDKNENRVPCHADVLLELANA